MVKRRQPEEFYASLIDLFLRHNMPFMIGGTYAFTAYLGIKRETKDMDLFCPVADYPKLLQIASTPFS